MRLSFPLFECTENVHNNVGATKQGTHFVLSIIDRETVGQRSM